jgi:hypothetical protein
MACTYTYNGKEYSFNELSLLLKNGLADELYANNVISNPGVYTSQVISTGEDIQVIDSSNLSANVLGNTFSANMYRQAQKIVKSLSKIAPNLSFQFVNSTEEMARIANELGKPSLVNSDAFYAKVNGVGTVYINMPVTTANNRGNVAFHEGLHPLTNALFNAQPELRDQMHSQIVALANDKNLTDEQRAIINEAIQFGKGYTEDGPDVEKNEVIVEFLSKVANQELTFDPKNRSTWNAITDFLNNLAGLLGINLRVGPDNMTANNVVAFANIVGDALRGGETIAFDDIMKQTNENIDNAATYQYPENLEDAIDNSVQESRKIGNMGIVKTANMEEGKYDKLKKAGKIVFNATKNLIKNTPLTITFPDSMMVGKLDMPVVNLDGTTTVKTVSNGSGGVVFVAEFGDVWANGGVESTTANNLAKQINEKIKLSELIYGKGNGKTFLLLGQGSGGKMMSNRESLKGSVTIIENLHRLNVINDDTLKKSLEKALRTTLSTLNSQLSSTKKSIKKIKEETLPEVATKKYEKESDRAKEEKKLARQIQSKEREVIEIQKQLDEQTSIVNDFVDQIKSTEGGALEGVFERLFAENSTFQSRGSAMKTLWMQLYSNAPKGSEQRKAIMESVGVPETVTTQDDFLTAVGENLFEEPILNGVPPKYIYAAIEINNLVEVVPGTHESYPWHIKQIDGAQPTLHFFKDAFDSETIFYNASKGKMVEKAAQIGASQTQISYGNIFVAENKEDIDQIEAMLNKVKEDLEIQESRIKPNSTLNIQGVSVKVPSASEMKSIDAERTSMKWFKDKVNTLPSTPAPVNNIVFTLQNNVFALVTGQNPEATPMFESDNNKLTEASKKWLKERGYTEYYPVVGRYGVGEESLMVPYMTEQDALDFCNAFKQDSVATNDKILYKDGSYNERDKEQDNFDRSIDEEGADFLSYINANGNKFGFSLGYNFESKYNKQGDKVDEEGNIIEPGASIIQQSYSGGSIISSTPTYQKATIDTNNNMVFYTNANMSKVDFSRGNNTHIISVDQKLVYPLAQDPLNIKADNKTDDAILAAANKLGFAVVVNDMSAENGKVDVMTNVSLSPKEIGTAVYPSNNQLIQESRTASIVEVTDPIITGKRNRSVYDSSVPVVEVSKMMNNSIGSVVREYFLPKRGASENIKSRQERINASMATTIDQIVEAANNAEKVINTYVTEQAKAKGITERAVQVFVTGAYNGEYNPATGNQYINELPPAVAAAVRNLRQSTQNLQEVMIKSDTVSPDVALVIKNSINNKGKLYSKRSFAAYEVSPSWIRKKLGLKKKWFANLPENVKTQARDKFIEYALDGSLDEGFALDVANYYKNYVNKLKEMDKAGVSPYDPNYIALADQKAIEEKRLFDEAGKIADEYMDKIERYNDGETTFSLGGKPIKMKDYKARSKAIPQEILDYLGEITDPVEVFRLTAMKLTRMAYSHQMIAQMKDLGMDAGMVLPPGKATPKGWIKLNNIADVDKRTMLKAGKDAIEAKEVEFTNPFGVLKGHSVHPAIYNMIFDTPVQAGLYYKYITSNIKKGKTVFSPVTLIKNWVGYVWFGLANGAVSEAIAFSPTVTRSIKDQYDKVGLVNYLMNVYNDSKKLGLNSSIDVDDFRNISDRLAQDKKLMAALANSSNPSETLMQHVMDMTWNGTKKTVEGVSDFFMQAMQLGDAIPKAMMFEIFRNSAAQVVAGTGYYQLSEEDKAKVDETAARRVKRTTVTDQRSIKAADFLQRKFGIFGTFPRFLVESLRNFSNNHLLVVNPGVLTEGVEFSKDPTKDKQIKRALAAKTVIAHVSGLVGYYSLLALVRSGLGFGDDDDDKVLAYNNMSTISQIGERMSKQEGTVTQSEALRFFLPDWDKYGNLSAQINKGGTVDYINLSSTDPFNVYHQVARAFVYAENPGAGAKEAAKQVLTPVLDYEIFFDAFKNAMSGVDDKGHRLYTDFDSSPEKAWAGMKYMWKKAAPGIVTTSVRYLEKTQREKKEATAGNAFEYMIKEGVLGRHSQLDVKRELGKIVKDLNKKWTDAVGIQYSEAIKSDSESDYNAAMERRNKNAREFASQVNLAIMNGYALGLSQNDVVEIMAKTRVPKIIGVAALAGGEYITNLKINDLMLRDPSWMSNPNEK